MDALYNHIVLGQLALIDGLIFLLCIFLCQEDLHRHERTVFGDDLPGAVLVGEFQALLIEEQGDLCTYGLSGACRHGEFRTPITLPVNRLCSFLIGKSIDVDLVRHHKCRIKTQAEVSDDLILIGLVLILRQEIRSPGKCDLVDVFFHFLRGHAKTVIDEFQSLLIRIYQNLHLRFIFIRKSILSHHVQLLQLGDGIASIGDQLTEENIMIGIKPLLDNRKNIVAVDRKISMFFVHISTAFLYLI